MKFTISLILCCLFYKGYNQVGIGTTTPNSKAQLEITSTNKGLLIPRMPLANRPSTPPVGLMIYQTDQIPGFYYYTGTAWKRMYAVSETDTMTINPNPGTGIDPAPTAGATGTVRGADSITYTTVRLGDGSVWLQQNLGSSRVATAADDALSYGDLYQWGRWTDGHEKRTPVFSRTITASEPNPNNPAGLVKQWGANVNPYYYGGAITNTWYSNDGINNDIWAASVPQATTANNGCDPCKLLLGGTWRLPTLSEWDGLRSNTQTAGVYLSDLSSALNSYLKLPGSGYRDAFSTTVSQTGIFGKGFFWSGFGNPNSREAAYFHTNGNTSYDLKGYGYSIRCKKD